MNTSNLGGKILSSDWGGSPDNPSLSKHLIASFYEVARNEKTGAWVPVTDGVTVKAPLTESNMEIALNWQSPFEQAGAESKAPALLAMLQSGALQPLVAAIGGAKNGADASAAQKKSNEFLSQFEGRTGITKLNSTQVFTGMPPVKIQVTALFRAWLNPADEVEAPFGKLMEWALPVELSPDGSILARAAKTAKGDMGYIEALMPSLAPTMIAMKYKGRIYSPLVIEAIGQPMNSPIDSSGRYTELTVPMTLCTLTAFDRNDWARSRQLTA